MDKKFKRSTTSLRTRAEELYKKAGNESKAHLSDSDITKLIHELEVHQIELELQNEELFNAREEAEKAREKYTELYDFAPVGYFTLTNLGEITEVNLKGSGMLGVERSRLKKMHFAQFVVAENKSAFVRFLEDVFKLKKQVSVELTLKPNNDQQIHTSVTGVMANNTLNCFLSVTDITIQKNALKSYAMLNYRLNMILDTADEGILGLDKDGNHMFVNRKAKQILGYRSDELLGKGPNDLYYHQSQSGIVSHNEQFAIQITLLSGKPCFGEEYFSTKNGEVVPIEFSCLPIIEDDITTGCVVAFRDISENIKAKESLIRAKEKAEESDRLKSAFLANMSHEIRTPMNGIIGFTELLKEPRITNETKLKYIEVIQKSGERMLDIINNLLDISRIEAGLTKVKLVKTNLSELFIELDNFFKPECEKKGLELIFKLDQNGEKNCIFTDEEKLSAILTNLIKNAIKFTHEGSIEVECKNDGENTLFTVSDTGIGIAKDRQSAIFERFIQADIEDVDVYEGAGLGLAISKSFVKMLGGEIWVESFPEEKIDQTDSLVVGENMKHGSVFSFTIPCKGDVADKPDEIPGQTIQQKSLELPKLKILIVEDDDLSLMFLEIALKPIANEILIAQSGMDAIDTVKNNPDIDLVLMDVKIPKINGLDATREIRKFNTEVVIISQTAYGLTHDRQLALDAGCNDYISKPIKIEKLFALIGKYF